MRSAARPIFREYRHKRSNIERIGGTMERQITIFSSTPRDRCLWLGHFASSTRISTTHAAILLVGPFDRAAAGSATLCSTRLLLRWRRNRAVHSVIEELLFIAQRHAIFFDYPRSSGLEFLIRDGISNEFSQCVTS